MMMASRSPKALLRPPWLRVGLLSAVLVALVGCQASPTSTLHPSSSAPALGAIPRGDGLVVGGIGYCSAIYPPNIKAPYYVAGTVIVLRGTTSFIAGPVAGAPGASGRTVLPTVKVTSQTVLKHREFRFALPPGPYVLAVAPLKDGYSFAWVPVVIRAGRVTRQDVTCMAI